MHNKVLSMHFFELFEITNTIRCYKDVDYHILAVEEKKIVDLGIM